MTDLTDKWKKGELPSGEYYIIDDLGLHTTDRYYPSHGFDTELPQSVLGRVPSYDEWKALNGNMDSVIQTNQALCKKLAELKELLKEVLRYELSLKEISELTRKICQVLEEDK